MTTWGEGEYELMAARLQEVAKLAVEAAAVGARDRVLDLACGTGNAAVLAAGRGAHVVGVDVEPVLLELARRRDPCGRIDWCLADVAALGFADAAFSVVLSIFGVMYATDQQAAAWELARCCAAGGRIALAAWTAGGFMPAMGQTLAPYLPPPPPAGAAPSRWGEAASVEALLGPHGIVLRETSRHEVVLTFADLDAATEFVIRTAGHVVHERARLEREQRWPALVADLTSLVATRNRTGGAYVELALEYLLVLGERPLTSGKRRAQDDGGGKGQDDERADRAAVLRARGNADERHGEDHTHQARDGRPASLPTLAEAAGEDEPRADEADEPDGADQLGPNMKRQSAPLAHLAGETQHAEAYGSGPTTRATA